MCTTHRETFSLWTTVEREKIQFLSRDWGREKEKGFPIYVRTITYTKPNGLNPGTPWEVTRHTLVVPFFFSVKRTKMSRHFLLFHLCVSSLTILMNQSFFFLILLVFYWKTKQKRSWVTTADRRREQKEAEFHVPIHFLHLVFLSLMIKNC